MTVKHSNAAFEKVPFGTKLWRQAEIPVDVGVCTYWVITKAIPNWIKSVFYFVHCAVIENKVCTALGMLPADKLMYININVYLHAGLNDKI